MPSSIRPVTNRFPASRKLWEETNLPLCAIVTPCGPLEKYPTKDVDAAAAITHKPKTLLSAIPKCLHCGAPHPTKTSHFRPMHHSVLLCYLCGKTSSTKLRDQREARTDELLDPQDYDTGVFGGEEIVFDLPIGDPLEEITSVPAMTCPPVWWIVLDASQHKRQEYWNAVGSVLESTIQSIPSHVHVGIVAANSDTVASWDLTTPIPHVLQYPYDSENVDLCLVPADALHHSCIQSALRAVADAHGSGAVTSTTSRKEGMALGNTLELILEYMEKASHPGENPQEALPKTKSKRKFRLFGKKKPKFEDTATNYTSNELHYAGGKILVLLGNPPMEITTKPEVESQTHYFQGGVAGACSADDKWEGKVVPDEDNDPSDMTPQHLKEYTEPLKPEDMFCKIGKKCANAALGVDLIVVVPENEGDVDEDLARLAIRPWYGLPLLRALTDYSGAPGPLMFGSNNVKGLQEQLLVRAPWQPGMTFGTELRLRLSPGFELEDSPVEKVGRAKLQVATFLASGGIMGPAVSEEPGLWLMGTCDPHTCLTVDIQADKKVKDRFKVDGFGEVALKPVIQTCVAYTCIEKDEDGNYHTVRKMRVSSVPVPLSSDTELFFDALDPEVLTAVLFHKLALNAYQEGFKVSPETAESWLRALLVCVYQSAIVEQARIEKLMDKQGRMAGMDTAFKGHERLLDQEGDLEVEDVLMGKGHEKVSYMPLMLFALLQSDALRPTVGSFRPSMDARCAAITQMAYMSPSIIAKYLAPTLQLWSAQDDELILESVNLSKKSIHNSLEELQDKGLVLLLNSPQRILVYRPDRAGLSEVVTGRGAVRLGPKLKAAVDASAKEYVSTPEILYELGDPKTKEEQDKGARRFDYFLLEDKATASGIKDYTEWKVELAVGVQE